MRTIATLGAAGWLLASAGPAFACSECMCGAPFPASVLGGLQPAAFSYGVEDRYLSKASALDEGPGQEQEREHRVAAFAIWRPAERLALLARVPYDVKEIASHPVGAAATLDRAHGLGDAELLALIGLAHTTGARPWVLGGVAGVTAPTGSNELRGGTGERLDAHLQPGAGAWSGTAGLHVALTARPGVWDASVLGRANGTSAHGYRYGSALLYNAGFTSRAWQGVQALAQINGRSAARDHLDGGGTGINTGGTVLYASPGLRWSGVTGVAVDAALQIPVAQRLYGDQREHTTARLALSLDR
ncbi:MAG TPA: hypothetical protein VFK69_13445 [Candidatus Eisenbacteria bacterium]|nr:hypothetical protein [Candidatus Eisenbacteria bacterium]